MAPSRPSRQASPLDPLADTPQSFGCQHDPATGKQAGETQIGEGADVIFGVGGNTGNGGLLAAHEAGLIGIGVDVDQYNTYPEVQSSLISSAAENMDVAAGEAVRAGDR